jgi:hypothetical protein
MLKIPHPFPIKPLGFFSIGTVSGNSSDLIKGVLIKSYDTIGGVINNLSACFLTGII